MTEQSELDDPEEIRLHNITDMGLAFSAMIRLFKRGSKKKLRRKILDETSCVFKVESEESFASIHSDFCDWGVKNILLAEKKRNEQVIKRLRFSSAILIRIES